MIPITNISGCCEDLRVTIGSAFVGNVLVILRNNIRAVTVWKKQSYSGIRYISFTAVFPRYQGESAGNKNKREKFHYIVLDCDLFLSSLTLYAMHFFTHNSDDTLL